METNEIFEGYTVEEMVAVYFNREALIEPNFRLYQLNSEGHRYYYRFGENGEPVFYPSVTTLIRQTMPTSPFLIDWIAANGKERANELRDLAAAYGTFMHGEFEKLAINRHYNFDACGLELRRYMERENLPEKFYGDSIVKIRKDVLAFAQFMKDYKVRPLAVEIGLYSDRGYAGCIDLPCILTDPKKGEEFPADVFLLNPPYSAAGKGFVFVEKALSRMKKGRAAILIQENAGSGEGLPYTANILKHSTLLASIHMADIFKGKASVRTAVYVFEVGKRHKAESIVRFIDFDNDGYVRQNKKKAGLSVNLRDADHARERYEAVVKIALHGAKYLAPYFDEGHYIEDTIAAEGADCGKDWTFAQHRKVDTQTNLEDFQKVVQEYLSWKVGTIIKSGDGLGKSEARA